MTDPTPTPQAPPQGLTDAQLLELAAAANGYEMCGVFAVDCANHYEFDGSRLIVAIRAAIAADREANGPEKRPAGGDRVNHGSAAENPHLQWLIQRSSPRRRSSMEAAATDVAAAVAKLQEVQ